MIITGSIFITSNLQIINEAPIDGSTKIINMDEDGSYNHDNNPNAIGGLCLLPPMEAKIAEADGDEALYDKIYADYLHLEYQQRFISVLIAFMAKGGNLIIYLPDEGYTNTKNKLMLAFRELFGIIIGDLDNPIDSRAGFNAAYAPCWANMLFKYDLVNWKDYLLMMPADARLDVDPVILPKLADIISPYANNRMEQYQYIIELHQKLHINPNIMPVISIDLGGMTC